jgi:hypothetical protein
MLGRSKDDGKKLTSKTWKTWQKAIVQLIEPTPLLISIEEKVAKAKKCHRIL